MPKNNHFSKYADLFLNSIYNSPKGAIRLAVLQRDLLPYLIQNRDLQILDLGCGAGQISLWAASFGHKVDMVDLSTPLLNQAKKNATLFGVMDKVNFYNADIFNLPEEILNKKYDFIFCYAVLEWIEDINSIFNIFDNLLKSHGKLSLAYYNLSALEFIHNVFGNFNYLSQGLKSKKAAKMTPQFPRYPVDVEKIYCRYNFRQIKQSGICCFYDYMKEKDRQANSLTSIITRELIISGKKEFLPVARYIYELLMK